MLYKDIIDNTKDVTLKRKEDKKKAFVNSIAEIVKSLPLSEIDAILKTFDYACKKGVADMIIENISPRYEGNRFEEGIFVSELKADGQLYTLYGIGKNYVYFPLYSVYGNGRDGFDSNYIRFHIVIYKKNVYICINHANEISRSIYPVTLDMVKVLVKNKQTLVNFAKSDSVPIIFDASYANKFMDITVLPGKLDTESFLHIIKHMSWSRIGKFVHALNRAIKALE